ncbi:hypothetical protein M9Y10_020060 [Tritrichomonas musculus]|uniref:Transposase Tc1-like domain-containing protein n=1 Tax=Tritrichomonas musculus TaxID=1915356 RepID=A0ABR2HH55_9EUKA
MFVCETPEEAIIRLHNMNKSVRVIKSCLHVGSNRIRNAIKYYEDYHQIPQPKKKGRPIKGSEEILAMITMLTVNDRTMTCSEISQKIFEDVSLIISPTTVFRLKKNLILNTNLQKFDSYSHSYKYLTEYYLLIRCSLAKLILQS